MNAAPEEKADRLSKVYEDAAGIHIERPPRSPAMNSAEARRIQWHLRRILGPDADKGWRCRGCRRRVLPGADSPGPDRMCSRCRTT